MECKDCQFGQVLDLEGTQSALDIIPSYAFMVIASVLLELMDSFGAASVLICTSPI